VRARHADVLTGADVGAGGDVAAAERGDVVPGRVADSAGRVGLLDVVRRSRRWR